MILTCPSCETHYFAADDSLGPQGREVKCASCGHSWFVEAPGGGIAGSAPARSSALDTYRERLRARRLKRAKGAAVLGWLLVAGLGLVGVAGAWVYREDVVRAWPETASAYRWLGMTVNAYGLDFEAIERSRTFRGTIPVLSVSADIVNVSDRVQTPPRVRVGLLDDFGREIAVILAEVTPQKIAPGERGRFEAVLENPPPDSYSLDLRFLDPREDAARLS